MMSVSPSEPADARFLNAPYTLHLIRQADAVSAVLLAVAPYRTHNKYLVTQVSSASLPRLRYSPLFVTEAPVISMS